MKLDLDYELQELYGRWLMEDSPEDFSCKDQLIELIEAGHRYDEFVEEIKRNL